MGGCFGKNSEDSDSDEKIDFGGGNVHVITSKQDWDEKTSEANRDDKIVVANFSATWCGPCKMISPLYVELSQQYHSLVFLTIDVDQLVDFSSSWDIRATPTFFFMKDGQQLDKLVGANKPELRKKIVKHAESTTKCSQSCPSSQ